MNTPQLPIWVPASSDLEIEQHRIAEEIASIGMPTLKKLAKAAAAAGKHAYSPYSKFIVGAAVLDRKGNTYTGQNIEIATMSETGHAEEQAIKNAVSAGALRKSGRTFLRAVASTASPCGRCRQIMQEFSDNTLIVVADKTGAIRYVTSLRIMLPESFGPKDIGR